MQFCIRESLGSPIHAGFGRRQTIVGSSSSC